MDTTLADEQRQAIQQGHGVPVYVKDPLSGASYVLISVDSCRRIRGLFGGEDPFDIRETYTIQDHAAGEAWSHPDDAAYDNYDAHPKKS